MTAETATLHEAAGRAHRGAPAALDVSAVLDRHFLIRLQPSRSCFDRDRRNPLRRGAAARNESVVHRDAPHLVRPYQQGVRSIRSAQIIVASALDHQPQPVLAREVQPIGSPRVDPASRTDSSNCASRPRTPRRRHRSGSERRAIAAARACPAASIRNVATHPALASTVGQACSGTSRTTTAARWAGWRRQRRPARRETARQRQLGLASDDYEQVPFPFRLRWSHLMQRGGTSRSLNPTLAPRYDRWIGAGRRMERRRLPS